MTSPRSKFYQFATIIFQACPVEGGWRPRCTIVYGVEGKKTEHVIEDATLCATEDAADQAILQLARQWVDDYQGQPTGYPWTTQIDDESKTMWRELHDPGTK
jgi:hypothetical protein